MNSQLHPIVTLSSDSSGDDDDDRVEVIGECRKDSVVRFTEEQLDELDRQMIIFKYMVWGLPVPFQLLHPNYRKSSPLSIFRGGFDHQELMDPELRRCRRADAMKWKYHQYVIPNEKPWEKCMHQGHKRSRKLVEASPNLRISNLIDINPNYYPSNDIRPNFLESLDQRRPSVFLRRAPGLTTSTAKSYESNKKNNEVKCDIVANERIAVFNQASGLNYSPESVLQNDMVMRCPSVESHKKSKNISEYESRCVKNDGKKWRCKKEARPFGKFCAHHASRRKVHAEKPSSGSLVHRDKVLPAYGSISSSEFSVTKQGKVDLCVDFSRKIWSAMWPADSKSIIKDSVAPTVGSISSSEATESD